MQIPTLNLAQLALEIYNGADAVESCQRLVAALQHVVPGVQVSVLLTDATQTKARLFIEDGLVSGNLEAVNQALHLLQSHPGLSPASVRPSPWKEPGESRQLAALLAVKNQAVGIVSLHRTDDFPPFDLQEIQCVHFLAAQTGAAVELQRLYAAEQARLHEEQALIRAGRKLSEDLKPEELPLRILEQLASVVPFERGSLLLQEGGNLRIAAQLGFPRDERVQRLLIALRQGDVYEQIALSAHPLLVDDVTLAPGWTQVEWLPLNLSWLGIPLFSKDRVGGMVSLTRRERGAFSQEDVLMATAFAMQASVALENANLYAEITRFNQQLEQMVQQRTQELRQALFTLERMEHNRADFISVTAHELRTPLTVMKGYLGILESDASLQANPFLRQVLAGFMKGTERLYEIVESMLELVRIDNQQLEIEPGLVTVNTIARRVFLDYNEFLAERKQTLELQNLEGLPILQGDANLLLKVLQNIVINAIKYTPDGGKITISGRAVADEQGGEWVEILVQDSGIGIDPEFHELIFEKLYSLGKVGLHSTSKYTFKGGGPGLGLAIARGIVNAHGGKIWVESDHQDEDAFPGSCFHILLPVGRINTRTG